MLTVMREAEIKQLVRRYGMDACPCSFDPDHARCASCCAFFDCLCESEEEPWR